MEDLKARAERLASTLPLRDDDPRVADADASVRSLERAIVRADEYVEAETAAIDELRRLEAVLVEQQRQLAHIEAATPLGKAAPRPLEPVRQQQQQQHQDQHQQPGRQQQAAAGGEAGREHEQQPQKQQRRGRHDPPLLRHVSDDEVAAVPSYLRGRLTGRRLRGAIDEINERMAAKYAIAGRPGSRVKEADKERWRAWRNEETAQTKGRFFFADTDLAGAKHMRMDATGKNILNVLQHLGRLEPVRGASRRFIVAENA